EVGPLVVVHRGDELRDLANDGIVGNVFEHRRHPVIGRIGSGLGHGEHILDVERARLGGDETDFLRGNGQARPRTLTLAFGAAPLQRLELRRFGTFFPCLRASDNPIAIACLRLFTLPPRPPLPRLSVPRLRRCIALLTSLEAAREYRRAMSYLSRCPSRSWVKRPSLEVVPQSGTAAPEP